MQIDDVQFFFKNYVGYEPDNEDDIECSQDMIHHYVDSGLQDMLPAIYNACGEDGILNTKNIPRQLWAKDNILQPDVFYMHPQLRITNRAPVYNPLTGELKEYPYFYEIKERYQITDILLYASMILQRTDFVADNRNDVGAIKYLLHRYSSVQQHGLQPLDMILYLLDAHKGEATEIIHIDDREQDVYQQLLSYRQKLIQMDKFRIIWRGKLNG